MSAPAHIPITGSASGYSAVQLRTYRPSRQRISHVSGDNGGTNPVSNLTQGERVRTTDPFLPFLIAICLNGIVTNFFVRHGYFILRLPFLRCTAADKRFSQNLSVRAWTVWL